MKIGTLIKKLQEIEKEMPNAVVRLNDKFGDECLFTVCLAQPVTNPDHMDIANVVWLEGEHDNDMGEEIQAWFDDAIETGKDELDLYMEMLEVGIDVEMVRRYMEDDIADHMEEFCKEHGLI